MDFSFNDEQQQLRRTVREFAEAEIAPHVMEWDEASHFPPELIPKLADLGLLGVIFPEKYGGAGLGYIEYAIAIEELSRVDGSIGIIVAAHNSLCTNHIYKFGTEAQKQKYVVPLAQGKKLGCWSLTEPEAGSDAGGTRTTPSQQWRAGCSTARKLSPPTATTPISAWPWPSPTNRKIPHGISAFIVEKGTPGFRPGKKENKLGMRASDTSEVIFTDCRVPADNLLGAEGEGFINSLQILDGGRISIAALASAWRREPSKPPRNTPSSASNSARPSANFRAFNSSWPTWPPKLMPRACSCIAPRGWPIAAMPRLTRESSMAKLYASEVAVRVANEALQIFGGYGFIKDYPAEKFYRDVKLCTIGEGTSEIQRLVIARQILGKR